MIRRLLFEYCPTETMLCRFVHYTSVQIQIREITCRNRSFVTQYVTILYCSMTHYAIILYCFVTQYVIILCCLVIILYEKRLLNSKWTIIEISVDIHLPYVLCPIVLHWHSCPKMSTIRIYPNLITSVFVQNRQFLSLSV